MKLLPIVFLTCLLLASCSSTPNPGRSPATSRSEVSAEPEPISFEALKILAEDGDVVAQAYLGQMYGRGVGVEVDFKESLEWYRKAADQGFANAQANLGRIYRDGLGVDRDFGKSLRWYRKAAEQGNVNSQANLGWMHWYGMGIPKDYVAAFSWYSFAAVNGDADSVTFKARIAKRMNAAQKTEAHKLTKELLKKYPKTKKGRM